MRSRLRVALGLAGVLLGSVVVGSSSAADCELGYPPGRWVELNQPAFTDGPASLVSYAVMPRSASDLVATNGVQITVSRDGGCTWATTFAPLHLEGTPVSTTVAHLAVSQADPRRVYAATRDEITSTVGVLRSDDAGTSWRELRTGLEGVRGRALQLVVAPSDGNTVFLTVEGERIEAGDTSAEVVRSLYASEDGTTFEEREASPLLVDGAPAQNRSTFGGVAVEPLDPNGVWLFGGFGLHYSSDGARTSQERVGPGTVGTGYEIGAVDLAFAGDVLRVLAFSSIDRFAFGSFDGGQKFFQVPTPGVVRSSATVRDYDELAIATDTTVVYQSRNGIDTQRITPRGPAVRDLRVSLSNPPVLHARTGATILRWTVPDRPSVPDDGSGGRPKDPPPGVPGSVTLPDLPPLPTAALTGPGELRARAGEAVTGRYRANLPGIQRADVFFLVDVSDSMSAEIDGLRSALAGIVTELVGAGIDAHFGVGRFNTYNTEAYYRVTPVVPPGAELVAALDQLNASSGGEQKSHLEAVLQAASGRGRFDDNFIPPNQQAGFRAESPARVVLMVTDEPVYEQSPSPSYAQAVQALKSAGALPVGLAFESGDILPRLGPGPEAGLGRIAREAGSLAPAGGVDCDGDGLADVPAGDPLVCLVPSERSGDATTLANAIVNLVRSVPNVGTMEVAVSGGDDNPARPRVGLPPQQVDFATTVTRDVPVTFTCPPVLSATSYPYSAALRVAGAEVSSVRTTLTCEPVPAAVPPARADPQAAAVPPPPAPGGNPQLTNPNANPNPNPNPNAQSQTVQQAGMAEEQEAETQLAVAYSDLRAEEDGAAQLAMSLLSGVALAAASGTALRRRARGAGQPASALSRRE
jgi:hypothetical protein